MKKFKKTFLILLLLVCIFDPADSFTHFKMPLFFILFSLFMASILIKPQKYKLPPKMLLYILLFSFVFPLVSIVNALASGEQNPQFDGFTYFKSFLFLTFALILYIEKIDLLKEVVTILTLMSLFVMIFFVIDIIFPPLSEMLYNFGNRHTIFTISYRDYGGIQFPAIYFHTSPLLILPILYFAFSLIKAKKAKLKSLTFLLLNFLAMFFSGTRANILISCIAIFLVVYFFIDIKYKLPILSFSLLFLFFFIFNIIRVNPISEVSSDMFSSQDISNSIKLSHFNDYMKLFKNPKLLFLGQGLGSFFYSSGREEYISNSELTYFELVRRFGLFIALFYLILMLYPLKVLKNKDHPDLWLYIGYGCYLIMTFVNPIFFSSNGIIILSLVLNKFYSQNQCPSHSLDLEHKTSILSEK